MGFFGRCFTFGLGVATGIYIAQSYKVPKIKDLLQETIGKAKQYEETYRKPEGKGRDSDRGS